MGRMKDLYITIYGGGEDAVEAAKKLSAAGEWIPVSEQLPPPPASEWEDGVRVLAWSKGNGIDPAWFYRDSEYGDRWSWDSTTQPTHWMPLPEPPLLDVSVIKADWDGLSVGPREPPEVT